LGEETNLRAVEAAWYRFKADFFPRLNTRESIYKLGLQHSPEVLVLKRGDQMLVDFPIEITSSDPKINKLLDEVVPSSPFAKARTRKVLYVAGGPAGFDRLFLDIFNHSHLVHETSLFFKPSIATYPDRLLDFIQASDEDKQRRQILINGLLSGRCLFDEILNRRTLRQMITTGKNGKFFFYPATVTQTHIEAHLSELMRWVADYHSYRLILTDCPMPFLLALFEIHYAADPECYTVFFKQLIAEHDPDINAFVVNDHSILQNVKRDIVDWIMSDPSTLSNREAVINELKETLEQLRAHGPIVELADADT
jgi:hypothetical protein